jgi:5-formyltetrahydrofolate cyclo-ligase
MSKPELRQTIRSQIAKLSPEEIALFDQQIMSSLLTSQSFMPQSSIACYMPLKGEVSCKSLIQTLFSKGHTICLPAIVGRESPMIFRQYRPGDILERGIVGALEPSRSEREVIPDIIILPMMGYTRQKYRLGYSTGFYDRTLEAFQHTKPVKTIGLAYSLQELTNFPAEPHDIPLDIVITEKEIII